MIRRAIVTGAYGAIGKAIAHGIASHGMEVTLVGRDESRLRRAAEDIGSQIPGAVTRYAVVDLSREKEIREFSQSWKGHLQVLVNNAATCPRNRTETHEGIEMQWAANVLGYYWMIHYFAPFMKGEPGARIVNVASYWAGGLDLNDPEFRERIYDNDTAYRQSKQADRMLAAGFAKKFAADRISVNACHPGDVLSKVSRDLGFGGSETPGQGAETPVWLAASPEVENITGQYFEHRRRISCNFMAGHREVDRLLEVCASY